MKHLIRKQVIALNLDAGLNAFLIQQQVRDFYYQQIAPAIEKTFDELVKYFKASKSSVSNSLKYLLQSKIIDYKTFSTDRKRYFFITDSFFRIYFEKVIENVKELKTNSFRTVSMRTQEYPDVNEKILTWIENANRFLEAIEKVMKDLNEEIVV